MNQTEHTGGLQLLDPFGPAETAQEGQGGGELGTPPGEGASRGFPRILVWALTAGLSAGLLSLREPLALAPLALALAATLAVTLATSVPESIACIASSRLGPFSLVAAVPAGLMLLVLVALAIGLLGGTLDRPAWTGAGTGAAAVGGVLLLTGLVSWRRGGRVIVVGPDWPALTGAGLLGAFFCWVVATQPFEQWSRAMSTSTDFLRHLGMVRGVRDAGLLEPGAPTYPRTFHATVAWLSSAMGLEEDSPTLWRAAQPLALLLLVVMLLAVMAIAGRASALLFQGRLLAGAGAVVAGASFVQTAWFSTFLDFGNVMNMIVAVGLLAILLTGIALGSRSVTSALVAGGAVAATANAWTLVLPVAALGCFPWVLAFFRGEWRDPRQWVVWISMGLLTLNGLVGVRATSVGAAASFVSGAGSTASVSNLFAPDWWWFAAVGLSFVAAVAAFRQGARMWAASVIGTTSGVVILTAYLLHVSGSTWDLMLYYPVKAMWTGLIVAVPTAAVGALVVLAATWRASERGSGGSRVVLRPLTIGIVVLALAGVAGRGAAFRPHLVVMGVGGDGLPNWSLAVIDALEDTRVSAEAQKGAIIMGVVPSTNVEGIVGGFVGMVDYLGMEALGHVGIADAAMAPVKWPLALRDSVPICQYLRMYPNSFRITGPNPAAGPGWILDSGCPASVVQPERWVTLEFEPAWLHDTPWEDPLNWRYPSVAEVDAARQ